MMTIDFEQMLQKLSLMLKLHISESKITEHKYLIFITFNPLNLNIYDFLNDHFPLQSYRIFHTFASTRLWMKQAFLFIFFLLSSRLYAQEHFAFSPISSVNGLSDNRVRTICQLTDGRMVIVTEGLVNLYDGATFRYMHYDEQKAYPLSDYSGWHHTYVDNENHLWLKNQHKLMLFDIRTELFTANIDSVFSAQGVKSHVVDFFIDSERNLWYLTQNDELIFRDYRGKNTSLFLTNVSKANGSTDQLYDIAISGKQFFLFYSSGVMICYDFETRKELYRENPFIGKNNPYTSTLMVVPYKQYLYQARNGLNCGILQRFNTTTKKWDQIFEVNYWLNTLTVDRGGNCWISSFEGLWTIDENLQNKRQISPIHLVDGRILESQICTQYNDNKGGLWVGTVNRGVMYYHPDRFKFRNYGRSLFKLSNTESLSVNCFTEKGGDVLVGTQKGVFRLSKGSQNLEPFNLLPANIQCEALLTDSKQRIWVGTRSNGLFCIDKEVVKHFSRPEYCQYLYEDSDGNFYLCNDEGVHIFDPQTGNSEKIEVSAGRKLSFAYQLVNFRKNTLLGFDDVGLFLFDRQNKTIFFPENSNNSILQHSNHHYHSLLTDRRGLTWMGTMDGLNVYNPENNTVQGFSEEDGLINNSIRSITEDSSGKIWVATSYGISCIDVTSNGGKYQYSFVNFNPFDGVIENEFLPRSAYKTSDNRLLWGGLDGFNEIDLKRINSSEQQLSIPLFTKFFLSGNEIKQNESYRGNVILKQSISSTKEIRLKYFQNFLGIEFSALNYINPTQTYYRYKLEGADDIWREIKASDGVGRINYTNLPFGTYRLKIYAANSNLNWGSNCAELTLIINPPFWKTLWAYAIYLLLLIGALYLVFSYYVRRNGLEMQKQKKEELDQLKFSFFTNISHELRTPLTLILTPLDSILKRTDEGPLKKQLSGIYRNANNLLNLVNQLLDFRKLEMNGEKLNLSYCNIGEFIETIAYSFKELISEKEIDFTFDNKDENLCAYIDVDKFQRIVNNLLSNALKFTPEAGRIVLRLQKDVSESTFKIQITDTGCGISEVDLAQIFDRFYQVKKHKNPNTGSGIGLHLVNEYVRLHNGTIEVESRINEGCTFTITLPDNLHPEGQPEVEAVIKGEKHSLKLLIVEDNTEFRTFLRNELSGKYHIIIASNGLEGIEKAREQQPDLVITDVMMPEMTGTELCHQLKNDVQISHIPVILLTAKASDKAQIEGFEAGADAYITKPFNMEILLMRIDNLIEQQDERKNAFRNTITINPESFTSTNVDEDLIKKVLNHIERNMGNTSYSVEQLSKDMFMDRTGLYRKLSAIVGQSPTEFIRSVRLKRAAQLLGSGLSVTEVAERVGFGTTSYFTKCFHEEYGIKPSQYNKQ